ncbi:MAG: transposase [Thermoplasmata archaeon]|nr:transposase [Thermoplasmata archaeon]
MDRTMRTMIVRLYPNREQERQLNDCLYVCHDLYNILLEHCIETHKEGGKHPSAYDLEKLLPEMKQNNPKLKTVYSQVLCDVCFRLSRTFDGFFRRVKEDPEHAGFPRFRSWKRYDSFTYTQKGFKLSSNHIRLSPWKMDVRIRGYRKMDGTMKTCTIIRKGAGPNYHWEAAVTFEMDGKDKSGMTIQTSTEPSRPIGIDLGLRNIVVTSEGTTYPNRKNYIQAERQVSKILRKMSKFEKGSKERERYRQRLFHAFERLNNVNRGYIHAIVNSLLDNYDMIIMEDLQTKELADRSRSKGMRKSYRDAGWSKFIFTLGYKAAEAGIQVVKVDPAYTSQQCSKCGIMVPKDLSVRRHQCPHCGLDVDRD